MSKSAHSASLLLPFELMLNRCIASDSKVAGEVANLSGKCLLLQVNRPSLEIYIHFYPASVVLSNAPRPRGFTNGTECQDGTLPADGEPVSDDFAEDSPHLPFDGSISGSATALLGMLGARPDQRPLVNPAIQVGGDGEFVQSVYRLFSGMEIDWQEPLSRIIGDVPTHGLQQLLAGVKNLTRSGTESVKRNIDEYLHEEGRLVPPGNQVEVFDQELDALRLRLDRLQARIDLLTGKLQANPDQPAGNP